jgi:hypothetical protein
MRPDAPDVIDWTTMDSRRHPTPYEALEPQIAAFCQPYVLVLDPVCDSASRLVAARRRGRT